MDPRLIESQKHLATAMQALRQGDRQAAFEHARQAAALNPESEEPWLLLGYLVPPSQAGDYLNHALQINPNSQRARAGLEWLAKTTSVTQAIPSQAQTTVVQIQPVPIQKKRNINFLKPWLVGFCAVVLLFLIGWGVWQFSPVMAARPVIDDSAIKNAVKTALAQSPLSENTPTPGSSATLEPIASIEPSVALTSTLLPTKTATAPFTPTPKPTSTRTPTRIQPTKTPVKEISYTVKRGDTLGSIARAFDLSIQDLINANTITNPSVIYPGQTLIIPAGGSNPPSPLPTAVNVPANNEGTGKEIYIDISEQHLYAYENGKLVFSYVVSTGIGNSTRIGTFKVLDKIPNAYSSRFNIWMPWWMGIYYSGTLENGIHGLPLLSNGVELWGNLLGQPATYGCIEARTWEIKKLYDWAEIGTPVIIRR